MLFTAVRQVARRLGFEITPTTALLPRDLRGEYAPLVEALGSYRFKFLDLHEQVPTMLLRARRVGLTRRRGLRVLDIGAGSGFFARTCVHLGHAAVALDREGNDAFRDVCRWLGVDRRAHEITAFAPLPPLGGRFDVVTAFLLNFDRFAERGYAPWGVAEWRFFLADLATNVLTDDGTLWLQLNPHTQQCPDVVALLDALSAERRHGLHAIPARAIAAARPAWAPRAVA